MKWLYLCFNLIIAVAFTLGSPTLGKDAFQEQDGADSDSVATSEPKMVEKIFRNVDSQQGSIQEVEEVMDAPSEKTSAVREHLELSQDSDLSPSADGTEEVFFVRTVLERGTSEAQSTEANVDSSSSSYISSEDATTVHSEDSSSDESSVTQPTDSADKRVRRQDFALSGEHEFSKNYYTRRYLALNKRDAGEPAANEEDAVKKNRPLQIETKSSKFVDFTVGGTPLFRIGVEEDIVGIYGITEKTMTTVPGKTDQTTVLPEQVDVPTVTAVETVDDSAKERFTEAHEDIDYDHFPKVERGLPKDRRKRLTDDADSELDDLHDLGYVGAYDQDVDREALPLVRRRTPTQPRGKDADETKDTSTFSRERRQLYFTSDYFTGWDDLPDFKRKERDVGDASDGVTTTSPVVYHVVPLEEENKKNVESSVDSVAATVPTTLAMPPSSTAATSMKIRVTLPTPGTGPTSHSRGSFSDSSVSSSSMSSSSSSDISSDSSRDSSSSSESNSDSSSSSSESSEEGTAHKYIYMRSHVKRNSHNPLMESSESQSESSESSAELLRQKRSPQYGRFDGFGLREFPGYRNSRSTRERGYTTADSSGDESSSSGEASVISSESSTRGKRDAIIDEAILGELSRMRRYKRAHRATEGGSSPITDSPITYIIPLVPSSARKELTKNQTDTPSTSAPPTKVVHIYTVHTDGTTNSSSNSTISIETPTTDSPTPPPTSIDEASSSTTGSSHTANAASEAIVASSSSPAVPSNAPVEAVPKLALAEKSAVPINTTEPSTTAQVEVVTPSYGEGYYPQITLTPPLGPTIYAKGHLVNQEPPTQMFDTGYNQLPPNAGYVDAPLPQAAYPVMEEPGMSYNAAAQDSFQGMPQITFTETGDMSTMPGSTQESDNTPASSRPCDSQSIKPDIIEKTIQVNPDGTFLYSYETANGIRVAESGRLRDITPQPRGRIASNEESMEQQKANSVFGGYSYTAPDGTFVSVRYVADENGFRTIPEQMPVYEWESQASDSTSQ